MHVQNRAGPAADELPVSRNVVLPCRGIRAEDGGPRRILRVRL
jgi:hypothetical protein